jgi:hypothetical protein
MSSAFAASRASIFVYDQPCRDHVNSCFCVCSDHIRNLFLVRNPATRHAWCVNVNCLRSHDVVPHACDFTDGVSRAALRLQREASPLPLRTCEFSMEIERFHPRINVQLLRSQEHRQQGHEASHTQCARLTLPLYLLNSPG